MYPSSRYTNPNIINIKMYFELEGDELLSENCQIKGEFDVYININNPFQALKECCIEKLK